MIYHRSNNRRTPSRKLDSESGSVEDLPQASNHHTTKKHKISRGSVMCLRPRGGGEKYLLQKIQEL